MSARRLQFAGAIAATSARLRRMLRWQRGAIERRQGNRYLLFGLVLALGVWSLDRAAPFLHSLELDFLDRRFRARPPPVCAPALMTLDLDADLIARAGTWPIPRRFYAELATALHDHGASWMVMDIFFPDESPVVVSRTDLDAAATLAAPATADPPALEALLSRLREAGDDALLTEAFRATRFTVLAQTFAPAEPDMLHDPARLTSATESAHRALRPDQQRAVELSRRFALPFPLSDPAHSLVPRATAVAPPVLPLLEQAAGLGFAQVIPDTDGIVRKYPMFMAYDGRLFPSLALQAVLLETGVPVTNVLVKPGREVILPGARVTAPGGAITTADIHIPVDPQLRAMVNWTGDYLDTFRHMPASVLLRFRAVDLAGQRFRELRDAGTSPLAMDAAGITDELTARRLVSAADAADIVRTLLFAVLADAETPGLDAATRAAIAASMAGDDREMFVRMTAQVAVNRRLLAALRDAPAATYAELKQRAAVPDEQDVRARHAAECLRRLLASGRAPADCWPLVVFDPVRVRSGNEDRLLSPLDLDGALVFVGLTAVGTFDYNPTPFSPRYPMVGLHVNVANSLLTRQFIGFLTPGATLFVALVGAFVMALITPRLSPFWGAAAMLGLVAGYAAFAGLVFNQSGTWWPIAVPLATTLLTYLCIVIHAFFVELNEKRDIRDAHLQYKVQVESELRVAKGIQDSALPRTFPPFPERTEFDLHASMDPAKEVGGDLFDFFFIAPNLLFFHVGDVSGKGIPAALFMMTTQTLVRSQAARVGEPHLVLAQVNDHLAKENEAAMFVTMLCATLNTDTGEVVLANAGHNPPLIRDVSGRWRYFSVPGGRILGLKEGAVFAGHRMTLQPGEALYFYTDGVPEASDDRGAFFSEALLEQVLGNSGILDMTNLIGHVRREVAAFTRGAPPSDDVTMLAICYNGPAGGHNTQSHPA